MWGIDRLASGRLSNTRNRLKEGDVAVLTHDAAVDRDGRQMLLALQDIGITPQVVFSPEHGLAGVEQAEVSVAASTAAAESATRFVSLYGDTKQSLIPPSDSLEGVTCLLIDLCDVGSRYYTYVWTALIALRAAAAKGIHTLILDRPNPISGDPQTLEGKPQAEGFTSFVGLEPLPIRHALTVGEILTLFAERDGLALGPEGAVSVVATRGWERHRTAAAWGRPFVPPSPNMPTVETALVYPGACLIEGTNLSEGRGTTTPFQVVGAPFLDRDQLTGALVDAALPGVVVRPTSFRPSFEKFAGQVCHGVMLHVTDPVAFRPVRSYLTLIAAARALAPEHFAFRTTPYEFEIDTLAFDLLTGGIAVREALVAGASATELCDLLCPVDPEWIETVRTAEDRLERAHA
jgi:uncharacterized protein YbbC (DUF1343 family)